MAASRDRDFFGSGATVKSNDMFLVADVDLNRILRYLLMKPPSNETDDLAGCDLAIAELNDPTRRDIDDDDLNSEYDKSGRCDLVTAAVGSRKIC
jgi:hypothetical protein